MSNALHRVELRNEADVVAARQRARLIAESLGFDRLEQTRISTSVSEIARNALQYGGGGTVEFSIEGDAPGPWLSIVVRDQGPGIADLDAILAGLRPARGGMGLGIRGSRRLLPDHFQIVTQCGPGTAATGTTVTLGKLLPPGTLGATSTALPELVRRIKDTLAALPTALPVDELRTQNQALLAALELLQQREAELVRVNAELTKTNSGVVALYVDLKASAQQVEQANGALQAFNYSVAHDLRSPLRALDGYANMLIEGYSAQLDDEGRRLLNVIRDEAKRMGRLIDDLLAFARISRQPTEAVAIDMTALAREVYTELIGGEPGRSVQFELTALPVALGTPSMIRQVWVNLLSNALKFTRNRPIATIEIGAEWGADGVCVYHVKDNGAGFDMRHADKLFGVFQRLHGQSEFEGNGVGLALVQRILERHGGRIWAEGEVGTGACFYFTLPGGAPLARVAGEVG